MFADGAQAQTPLGVEQRDLQNRHEDVHEVHEDVLVEQHRPDDRNVRQHGHGQRRKAHGAVPLFRIVRQDGRKEEAGQTDYEDVEDNTDDDLIDPVAHREEHQDDCHEHTADRCGDKTYVGVADKRGDDCCNKRTGQQLAFNCDVDDAGTFAHQAAHGTEDQRNRQGECTSEQRGCGDHAGSGTRPGEERDDEQHADGNGKPVADCDALELTPERHSGQDYKQQAEHNAGGFGIDGYVRNVEEVTLLAKLERGFAAAFGREAEGHQGDEGQDTVDNRELPVPRC